MPLPQKFCCCTLKQGTVVTGIVHLVIVTIWVIKTIVDMSEHMGYHDGKWMMISLSFFIYVLYVGIAGGLVYGALKAKRFFMLPWVMIVGSSIIAICYYGILLVVVSPIYLVAYAVAALFAYLWLCVFSLYENLSADDYQARNNTNFQYKPPSEV